jgi:hypothetical protein|tara:strand:+ start:153 stop:497 length:345 start_codon:yes stop_codon:yes gene_type:complete
VIRVLPPRGGISAQLYRNFGQHFGQYWWIFVQYHAKTIAAYGLAEGLNIDTLPASGTNPMIDQQILIAIAQVAITLAGFSGVVATFSGSLPQQKLFEFREEQTNKPSKANIMIN